MIVVAIDGTVGVRDFAPADWPQGWIGGGGAADFKPFLSAEPLSQGRTDEALALVRRHVDGSPGSATAHGGLADGCAKAGRWNEAAAEADRALALAARADASRDYHARQARKMIERFRQEAPPERAP